MKATLGLQFLLGYRVHIEPEMCHPLWNDVKNSIRRSGMQSALLKGVVMSNINHGPYNSGANMQLKYEALCSIVEHMSVSEFEELQERMAADKMVEVDSGEVPQSPQDLFEESTVKNRGIFASRLAFIASANFGEQQSFEFEVEEQQSSQEAFETLFSGELGVLVLTQCPL